MDETRKRQENTEKHSRSFDKNLVTNIADSNDDSSNLNSVNLTTNRQHSHAIGNIVNSFLMVGDSTNPENKIFYHSTTLTLEEGSRSSVD